MRVAAILAALITSACTTVPTVNGTRPVPAARVTAFQNPVLDAASVVVIRDSAFAGGMIKYRVLIDGALAARISTGERATFYVPPGEHILEVRHPDSVIGAIGDSATLHADASAQYFFRINSDIGQIKLLRTTESSATAAPPPQAPAGPRNPNAR